MNFATGEMCSSIFSTSSRPADFGDGPGLMYHPRLCKNTTDPINLMIEINPVLNKLKDLMARNEALRGYL